ncbi:ERCC4 domain-containing protein [Elizabethkingia argenteiflava]|uniref:ERCC4 domain-containing protein n=1 Tax=Elizabethkingia argenteiflava TaxID=2681556 RepID=UPI001FCE9652|nr:ERCC4 domain-containing protein [Elizabethkingia argenteiflava]
MFYTDTKWDNFYGNMSIANKLEAKEIRVTSSPTADFVFENNYLLPDLEKVEKHILERKQLPEIASAKEMQQKGVDVGSFQIKLLQKIEELTLYTIEQNKQMKKQTKVTATLEQHLEKLEQRIHNLEHQKP